jgi:hypothetical protein
MTVEQTAAAYSNALSQRSLEEKEVDLSEQQVSPLRFEPDTSQIQVRRITVSILHLVSVRPVYKFIQKGTQNGKTVSLSAFYIQNNEFRLNLVLGPHKKCRI